MAAHFSHKARKATIVRALQQLKVCKFCTHWVLRHLTEKRRKNCVGVALNYLTQNKEDGNDLLKLIITGDESWIHFYEAERK